MVVTELLFGLSKKVCYNTSKALWFFLGIKPTQPKEPIPLLTVRENTRKEPQCESGSFCLTYATYAIIEV